ncbi:MAG: response regulator [Spirochaetes bacterium]|nr:response regulator [Spirochaetota bacterium]
MSNDQKRRVLVVDDNFENLQMIGRILSENNYEVAVAKNGRQALDNVEKKEPDLVLLDVTMPDMDGFEVCRRIKDDIATRHIPIIFITSRNETEDIVKGFEAGAIDYVTKPFNTVELLVRIKTHIEMKILRGLIPICSSCKKIRNDQGYWDEIESFFTEHTDLLMSHSLCPDCMKKIYGNEEWITRE